VIRQAIGVLGILLLAPSAFAADVSVRKYRDPLAWSIPREQYQKPIWSWVDAGMLIRIVVMETGGSMVDESTLRAKVDGKEILVCYGEVRPQYSPGAPVPSVAAPVVIEYLISGISRDQQYEIKIDCHWKPN
jgi:hypothetical protein